jgi:glycosyltransferase involved in cell wall biosynthesis
MAAALLSLLQEPERLAAMRAHSLEQAARFSWQQTAAATLAIYRQQLP